MRNNQPVTGKAFDIPVDATLMSTTDPQSRVTYANEAFVAASGFTSEELLGQPHNLVRHPDMPAEAFADMWATLKGGEPWTGLVKNRRRDGDHYWVRANATPVIRGGRHVGYMSVRTRPQDEEIARADALYARMRAGSGAGVAFHKGLLVRRGWLSWTSWRQTAPLRWRLRAPLLVLWPLLAGAAAFGGLTGGSLGLFAFAAAVALASAGWWLESQVSRPMEQVLKDALRVASGESQAVTHLDRVDEIGMTLRTISQLGLMFRWLIDDVSRQAVTVQAAATEIAQGNDDLSARTEQAAASVEQTAASMEQMTATVETNAGTVGRASTLSASTRECAAEGGLAVAQVVQTMAGISTASKRIADIVGVIDGIAFQTNILALNAAVEAARAGEQGRGFAVVAGEVRSLSQRSAAAAREIKSLIGASVDQVDAGARLVGAAGKTIERVVSQVHRVAELIGDIGQATREQSGGIAQIGQAVAHLDQVTQQNAALVEQGAAASHGLQHQARQLAEAVGVFR